jgi:hypothetical protein
VKKGLAVRWWWVRVMVMEGKKLGKETPADWSCWGKRGEQERR